jgi:predicted aconitase
VKIEQLKVVSAAIGAGAAIAMVGIGNATSTVSSAHEPITPGTVTKPEATTGETITTTTPRSTPQTTEAKPSIEGPAPLPPEEGLPG